MADFLRRLTEPGADPIIWVRSKPEALTRSVHETATSRNSVVWVRRLATLVPARLQLFSRRYYMPVSPHPCEGLCLQRWRRPTGKSQRCSTTWPNDSLGETHPRDEHQPRVGPTRPPDVRGKAAISGKKKNADK